jgi:DNA-binding MurR/RpiR family transcriptional regulator
MPPLLKIRSERDQMSAIERRIADFLLENAHLLRDYSSQQVADALKISQSSVVKFSQKLGFKGYPDLKFSVGEAIARGSDGTQARATHVSKRDAHTVLAEELWRSKARAEEETRLINPPERIQEIAAAIDAAGKVFVIGCGEDDLHARAFSTRLTLLGISAAAGSERRVGRIGRCVAGLLGARQTSRAQSTEPAVPQSRRESHFDHATHSQSSACACSFVTVGFGSR